MRQLTDNELKPMINGWQEYLETVNPVTADFDSFEGGFITGLDHSAAQLAALTAERDTLSGVLRDLRAALQQIADGNPAPPGGKWLSDAKMAQIARLALDTPPGAPKRRDPPTT